MNSPEHISECVIAALTDDLRRPPWRGSPNPLAGHCYVASEAAWHLLGGLESPWRPAFIKHEGESHWFLKNIVNSNILDITVGQFSTAPDYANGIRKGFLTKKASKRAEKVIQTIRSRV